MASVLGKFRHSPRTHVDRALAWYGVASTLRKALGRRKRWWDRLPAMSPSRNAVAITAGIAALAVGAYAVRRHHAKRVSSRPDGTASATDPS